MAKSSDTLTIFRLLFGNLESVTNSREFHAARRARLKDLLGKIIEEHERGALTWRRTAAGLNGDEEAEAFFRLPTNGHPGFEASLILQSSVRRRKRGRPYGMLLWIGHIDGPYVSADMDPRIKELVYSIFGSSPSDLEGDGGD